MSASKSCPAGPTGGWPTISIINRAPTTRAVPLLGGLVFVLFTRRPPQGPTEQPKVNHFDEETRERNNTYGKRVKTVTNSAMQMMNHTLAVVSPYKGNAVMPSTKR